jgi:hypothetical protein
MPDATITSTASTFGTISGTFAADQSTVTGTISGTVTGTLTGSVGVPGPAGPGVPAGGTAGQYLQKIDGVDYNTDWVTLNLSAYAPINSPVFTGDPQAPTPAFGDDDTSIATTAFVQAGLLGGTANARNLEVYVRNQSGSTIPAGSIVYISGATGNRPLITLAQANNDANSAQTMGFTKTSIANNGFGYVIVRGELENIDTSALTEGVQLYLSPTTAGTWTTTKPSAPQHLVYVGIVVRAHPTQGVILVAVQNGYELNELHDVAITSPTNGQVLKYNSSTNLWVNGTDSSGVAWGAITGTLSSQTDLQTALDGKYSTSNPAGYITSSALTGYATESWVTAGFYPLTGNPSGFITSSALSPYLTSATAASTYQTLSGMSSYLTTSSAASTYYPLSNPSGYIDSSALTGYATESWVTSQGYLTDAPSDGNQYVRLNGSWSTLSVPADYITSVTSPLSVTSGDLSIDLTGYATESYVTSQGYITSSALSPYLTSATAASTYQTISGMNAYAPLASPALTGNPTAPTPATGDDDTSIATTAFVKAQGYLTTAPVTSVAGKTGAVTLVVADVSGAAPLASPSLTGTPTSPTATTGTNTTQIATTAFVQQEVPAASTTAAGKVELATVAESHAAASTSLVPTPFGIQFAVAQGMSQRMDFLNTTAVSGSAAVTSFSGFREVYTSATLSAGRAAFFLGGQSGTTYTVFGSNGNEIKLDFSKKIWMAGRFSTGINSTYVGDANGTALITLGGYTGFATGNMTAQGIGLRKVGGTASVIQLIVHNGTTFTSVNTSKTLAIREQTDYMIYSDGAGNVSLYIEGVLAASTSAGPTGITADFGGIYREQVEQTASATVRYSMHCYGGYLCLE